MAPACAFRNGRWPRRRLHGRRRQPYGHQRRQLDTALSEVYYNDTLGRAGTDRANNPWTIDQPPPAIDVQTVALHENGHALELGHFGPPPTAVMNPVYAGIRQSPLSIDHAGMCAVWRSWPK